jgi:hypothetical protein
MAVASVIEIPGGTKEQYEQTIGELGISGAQLAPGQLVHVAGPIAGGWQVVNVYESQEAADTWNEKVMAARKKAGMPEPLPPKIFPVHRLAK